MKDWISIIIFFIIEPVLCYFFYKEGYDKGHHRGWHDCASWMYDEQEKEKKNNERQNSN